MREEKRKYYKNLQKGHHEPIIKEDLLQDIENGNFIVCLVPKIDTLTGEVGGAEALSSQRSRNSRSGKIS